MKIGVFEKEYESIQERSTSTRSTDNKLAVRPAEGKDGEVLEILRHRRGGAGNLEFAANRWSGGDVLRQSESSGSGLNPAFEEELVLAVGEQLAHGRDPERAEVAQDRDRLEEVGLALTVGAGYQIARQTKRHRGGREVTETRRS